MCDDCKKLVGASRKTRPHGNLTLKETRDCPSMMGSVDERYYVCSECGHEWMRETGTYGVGWL